MKQADDVQETNEPTDGAKKSDNGKSSPRDIRCSYRNRLGPHYSLTIEQLKQTLKSDEVTSPSSPLVDGQPPLKRNPLYSSLPKLTQDNTGKESTVTSNTTGFGQRRRPALTDVEFGGPLPQDGMRNACSWGHLAAAVNSRYFVS